MAMDFRETDLADLVEVAKEVANVVPGQEWGPILDFVERVVPLVERFSKSIMDMRRFEGGQESFGPADDVGYMDNPNPPRRAEPKQVGNGLTSQDIYAAILGEMAKMPADMPIGQALELARANKGGVLAGIEKVLATLIAGGAR